MEKQQNDRMEVVPFRGTELMLFEKGTAEMVALRPICDGMGVDWSSQLKRTKRDEMFSSSMVIMTTEGSDGRLCEMVCLPIDQIPFWLSGVQPERVKNPAAREAILAYRRDVVKVLFEHFILKKDKAERGLRAVEAKLNYTLEVLSRQIIDLYIEKYFKSIDIFREARGYWWMKPGLSLKRISERTNLSPGRISRLIRVYKAFLDITRIERRNCVEHSLDDITAYPLYRFATVVWGLKDICDLSLDLVANPWHYWYPHELKAAYDRMPRVAAHDPS